MGFPHTDDVGIFDLWFSHGCQISDRLNCDRCDLAKKKKKSQLLPSENRYNTMRNINIMLNFCFRPLPTRIQRQCCDNSTSYYNDDLIFNIGFRDIHCIIIIKLFVIDLAGFQIDQKPFSLLSCYLTILIDRVVFNFVNTRQILSTIHVLAFLRFHFELYKNDYGYLSLSIMIPSPGK